MGKCNFSILSYFGVHDFMNSEFDKNLEPKQNYDNLVAYLSKLGLDFDQTNKDNRLDFQNVVFSYTHHTNDVKMTAFQNYVKDGLYKPTQGELNVQVSIQDAKIRKALNFENTFKNETSVSSDYFGGDSFAFNTFRNNLRKRLFQKMLMNFTTGEVITNNDELDASLRSMKNEIDKSLINYLIQEGVQLVTPENVVALASTHFKEKLKTSGPHIWVNEETEPNKISTFEAYSNFTILANGFDNMVEAYNLNLVQINKAFKGKFDYTGKKYFLANNVDFAFSFGNENVSLLDETSTLIKTLVGVTNVVKFDPVSKRAYIDEGSFLEINSMNASMAKLKGRIEHERMSEQLGNRISPFTNLRLILERILTNENLNNPHGIGSVFTVEDLDNFRTIYNFYYKHPDYIGNDMRNQTTDGIHSLAEVFAKKLKIKGAVSTKSDLYVNITRYIDETVAKNYTASVYDPQTGVYKELTLKQHNNNKEYKTIVGNLDTKTNNSYQFVTDNHGDYVDVSKGTIQLGEITFSFLKPDSNKFSFNLLELNNISETTKNKLQPAMKLSANALATAQRKYDAIKAADSILGLHLFENGDQAIRMLLGSSSQNSISNLLALAGLVAAAAKMKTESVLKGNTGVNVSTSYAPFYNSRDKRFKILGTSDNELGNKFKSLILDIAAVNSILSGEHNKAVINSVSGTQLPGIGLISVSHDDKTNLGEIKELFETTLANAREEAEALGIPMKSTADILSEIPASHNLFTQYSPQNGKEQMPTMHLLMGQTSRTDIQNGDNTKNATKMSAAEIFTNALLGNFYGNIKDGSVALQPLIYSDKPGQLLKVFSIDSEFMYKGKKYQLNKMTPQQIQKLGYDTLSAQFKALETKLVKELNHIFSEAGFKAGDMLTILDTRWKKKNAPWLNEPGALDIKGNITEYFDGEEERKQLADYKEFQSILEEMEKGLTHYSQYESILPLFSEQELINKGLSLNIDMVHEAHYSGRGSKLSINNSLITDFKRFASEESYQEYMDIELNKMVRNMIEQYVVIDALTPNGNKINEGMSDIASFIKNNIDTTFDITDWVDDTGFLTYFKVYDENGNLINGHIDDLIKYNEEGGVIEDQMRNPEFKRVINPILEYFFRTNNLLSGNYNLVTAGGIHAHELKYFDRTDNPFIVDQKYNDRLYDEAITSARTAASDKRNVFAQATMHPQLQGLLNGWPKHVKQSVIEDIAQIAFNALGETDNFKAYDGSAFQTAIAMIMADESFGELATGGFAHKIIQHKFNPQYLVAQLEKFAVFGLTNELARRSPLVKHMIKKMLDLAVVDQKGNPIQAFDIFNPEYSLYDPTDPTSLTYSTTKNGYKMFKNIEDTFYRPLGADYIVKVRGFKAIGTTPEGKILYETLEEKFFDRGGNIETFNRQITISSVYELQEALGGAYSVTKTTDGKFKVGKNGRFSYSERSAYQAVAILTNYKKLIDPSKTIDNADAWHQPMKDSFIYQLNNTSGIKNGAENINSKNSWNDNSPLKYYITNTYHRGLQMKSDHEFDEEHSSMVTEMSQVLSAAEANGHFHTEAKQLYKNIANVVGIQMSKYNTALAGLDHEVYEIMTKELMNVLADKDEIGFAQVYLKRVQDSLDALKAEKGEEYIESIKDSVLTSFSDNNMYNAMVSMIAGSVNRTAIKRKYSGIAAVIRPGHNMYKIFEDHNGNIYDDFGEDREFDYEPLQLNDVRVQDNVVMNTVVNVNDTGLLMNIDIDVNLDDINNYYDLKENYNTRINSLPLLMKNAVFVSVEGGVQTSINLGAGMTAKVFVNGQITGDQISTINIPTSDRFQIFRAYGKGRNLYTKRVHITATSENGSNVTFDRYDLDSVRAEYALGKLSKLISNINKAEETLSDSESQYSIDQATKKVNSAKEELKSFEKTDLYKSLLLFDQELQNIVSNISVNGNSENILNPSYFKNLQKKLLKEVEEDHLMLKDGQVRVPLLYGGGNTIASAQIDQKEAEVILANVNRAKYGLNKGTTLGEVTKDFFKKRIEEFSEINSSYRCDFLSRSLDGTVEIGFLNAKDAEISKINPDGTYDRKDGHKLSMSPTSFVLTTVETDGNVEQVWVNPETGSIMFKSDPNLTFVRINGVETVIYKELDVIDKVRKDGRFGGSVFLYNYENGNVSAMRAYADSQLAIDPTSKRRKREHYRVINSLNAKAVIPNNITDRKEISRLHAKARKNKAAEFANERNEYDANLLYKSWIKQLEYIAARIPAQSLQSFMSMKVVGFIEEDINGVILPVAKNWLDGSDFDIDKTYMLGFSVDKKGIIYHLNDYFDFDHMETGFTYMTVPTGKEYVRKDGDGQITMEMAQSAINYLSYSEDLDDVKPTEQNYKDFLIVTSIVSELGYYPSTENETLDKFLMSHINSYHARIPSEEVLLESVKNSVAQGLYTIGGHVGNLVSAERPIEMEYPRNAAKKSKKAQDSREMSRANVMSMAMQIIQQNAGKSVVGISAVGEKVFFAYSYYINEKLNKLEQELSKMDPEQAKAKAYDLFREVSSKMTIKKKDGTITYPNLLANANMRKLPMVNQFYSDFLGELTESLQNENTIVEVLDVRTMDDASLIISAVLSAATDNAKELILDKINAGPELAGIYMMMIMQGMNFQDIADIMTSDVVNKVVKRSKQNWFNSSQMNNNINSAIQFFKEGPYARNYMSYGVAATIDNMSKAFAVTIGLEVPDGKSFFTVANEEQIKQFRKLIEKEPVIYETSYSSEEVDFDELSSEENDMLFEGGGIKVPNHKVGALRYIDDAILRVREIGNNPDKFFNDLSQFEDLNTASDETTIFGGRLGINQGIPTTVYDAYNFDYKLNSFLYGRFTSGLDVDPNDLKNATNMLLASGAINLVEVNAETGEIVSSALRRLSNIRWIYKQTLEVQKAMAALYNLYKFNLNLIDAELNLPHFKSMIEASYTVSANISQAALRNSLTMELIDDTSQRLPIDKTGYAHKFKDDEIKKLSQYVLIKTINEFLANSDFEVVIPPKMIHVAHENGVYIETYSNQSKKLDLSTPEGKASFKKYIENVLIPQLQSNPLYSKNKFVSLLTIDSKRNSITGKKFPFAKLNFNMSSIKEGKGTINQNAEQIFDELKRGFEEMQGVTVDGNRIWDLFALYNILVNGNAIGSSSFTKLFTHTSYVQDTNAPFYKFMEFEGYQDLQKEIRVTPRLIDEALMRTAPQLKKQPKNSNIEFFKMFDNGEMKLYRKTGENEYKEVSMPNKGTIGDYLLDDFLEASEKAQISNQVLSNPTELMSRVINNVSKTRSEGLLTGIIKC